VNSEQVWRKDYEKVDAAVQPFVFHDEDGAWISPDCPTALTDTYQALVSMGLLNGWWTT
jgi:hypothetical protein